MKPEHMVDNGQSVMLDTFPNRHATLWFNYILFMIDLSLDKNG